MRSYYYKQILSEISFCTALLLYDEATKKYPELKAVLIPII